MRGKISSSSPVSTSRLLALLRCSHHLQLEVIVGFCVFALLVLEVYLGAADRARLLHTVYVKRGMQALGAE